MSKLHDEFMKQIKIKTLLFSSIIKTSKLFYSIGFLGGGGGGGDDVPEGPSFNPGRNLAV